MLFDVPIRNRISVHWNHSLWLMILVLSLSLQAGEHVASWRYDQSLIANGDYWLLLSGHFVHLNWTHWGLNMAGLAIVAFFFSPYGDIVHWLFVVVVSAIFVGLGLFWLNPDVGTYVGLSGVLHGLFIYGAMRETRFYPASGYALLALLVAKLIWELMNGPLPGSEELTSGRVITDAHFYGALGGLFSALVLSHRTLFDQLVKIKNRQQDTEDDQ
jgi:rhomboid family GlyGly-CTERM serine protease